MCIDRQMLHPGLGARTDSCLPSLSAAWCLQLLLLLRSWDTPEETQREGSGRGWGVRREKTALVRSVPFLSKSLLSHPTVMLLEHVCQALGESCAHLSRAALPLRADPSRTLDLAWPSAGSPPWLLFLPTSLTGLTVRVSAGHCSLPGS